MKKGFTLIELLAVIIILAILMVIVVPNVLSTLKDAKEKTFVTQAQSIWKSAEQTYIVSSLVGEQQECYDIYNPLDLGSVSDSISYVVRINLQTGKVSSIKVLDTTQNFLAEGTTTNGITVKTETSDEPLSCETSIGTVAVAAPKLGNMIPIKYDGSKWVYADTTEEWYNYATREWANAVVLSSGVTKNVGDTISESEIDLWFVWIPRFEYKLPADSIGVTGAPKAIKIKFITTSQTTPTSGYAFHPGFAWDSDWSDGISEWKDGIWVGKFESTAAEIESDTVQKVKIKANTKSWRNAKVSNMYTSGLNLDTDYGITNLDSHMARYTEWTAVSYLTNSIYGRCKNATTCTEVTLNTSSEYLSGMGSYKSNVGLSTTGNVTGIYDLSGSAVEYVMGYLRNRCNGDGFTNESLPIDNKYTEIFIKTSSGDTPNTYTHINGITSMNGVFQELLLVKDETINWYGDYWGRLYSSSPWLILGGDHIDGSKAGVFSADSFDGGANSDISFRVALS